jgi:AraC-like DNA-binding protein
MLIDKYYAMPQEQDRQRIKLIEQMLFAMAAGNFSFKITRTELDDELEALCVLVNMLAEELRSAVFHTGFVNPRKHYQFFVQSTFVLDGHFTIRSFNLHVPDVLGLPADAICDTAFEDILSPQSIPLWHEAIMKITNDPNFHTTLPLQFISEERLPAPAFCTVSRLLHSSKILVSSVTMAVHPEDIRHGKENELKGLFSADAARMQELYDYILANLEHPLPSLQELSRIFGTNEHKLKDGFRQFFKTSIYQFYNEERLNRAKLLIEQSALPIKTIAFMCGFNGYPNFSKAFGKKFGVAPGTFRKN